MAQKMVRVRHDKHGGETSLPEKSIDHWRRKGWRPVGEPSTSGTKSGDEKRK